MKRVYPLLMILLLPCSMASAQEELAVPAEVTALVDQAISLVRSNIPRRVQTPVTVAVAGLQTEGRETQLGELFAMIMTTRLANERDSRIKVLAGQHLEALRRSGLFPPGELPTESRLTPDYIVNGKLYVAEGTLFAAVQLIQLPEFVVSGGIELSFPLSDAARVLLRPSTVAVEEGWDPYEPDSLDQPRRLMPGESLSGHTIMPAGDEDWFLLALDDFDGTGFMSVYTMGSTDTYIEVYGPDHQHTLLTENDDSEDSNARVSFAVEIGQHFWIKVRGYDESTTGSYTIASHIETYGEDTYEPNDRMEDASTLAVDGQWQTSLLMPVGDVDWYFIDVPYPGGQNALLIVETGGEMDTYLDLFDEDGSQLMSDDDGGSDANARINLLIESAGRYYVRVRHYDDSGSGPYRILSRIDRVIFDEFEPNNSIENATPIAVDEEEQRHTFVPGEDVDWFRFSISSGGTVTIETGGDSDTVMTLFDRDENLIAEDDDGGMAGNARIERFLQPGTYFVRITQFDDNPLAGAEYTVHITSR
ncbi:MAG: PPC domain-containing protein [Candidatus Latescibacteria bacterium]|nr:PPC domain-containing protein [Candidatus Latescibacterota bacterium]